MGLADAVVTVAVHVVAGVAVVQVDVRGTVGAAAGAELGEVAGVAGLSAGRARRLQLRSDNDHSVRRISAGYLYNGLSCRRTSHLAGLAALPVGTDGVAFQGAGGGVTAGIHAFLRGGAKKKKPSRGRKYR